MPSGLTYLHLLTAVTRPENLLEIARSVGRAAEKTHGFEIRWHHVFDLDREHVGGQEPKNRMLDRIRHGWVYVLDDDTVMHEDLLAAFVYHAPSDALVVSQQRQGGEILRAAPGNVRVGGIDIGQVILSRDLIGDTRLPESYEGDGLFLEKVLDRGRAGVYLDEVLCFHNALEGGDGDG